MRKMSVDINPTAVKLLETTAKRENRTPCTTLGRALNIYSWLSKQCVGTGNRFAIVDKDGIVTKIVEWQ